MMIEAVDMFKKYDRDGNKVLDRTEFVQCYTDCGNDPQGVTNVLNIVDRDGNGVVSFYEFLKWLNWMDMEDV